MGGRELISAEQFVRPRPVRAGVDERRDDERCVNDEHQRRSASR
jgi:hypothetical protein